MAISWQIQNCEMFRWSWVWEECWCFFWSFGWRLSRTSLFSSKQSFIKLFSLTWSMNKVLCGRSKIWVLKDTAAMDGWNRWIRVISIVVICHCNCYQFVWIIYIYFEDCISVKNNDGCMEIVYIAITKEFQTYCTKIIICI